MFSANLIFKGYYNQLSLQFHKFSIKTKAFVAGPDFSMADVWFYPFIAFSVRMGLELEKFPNMKAYYDKVTARPSVQKSWPPHWKEEPPMISPFKGRI